MQITVRDVAKFLSVSEKTVYRMIHRGEIPSLRIHDQYRFNRTELIEWAMARRLHTTPELLEMNDGQALPSPAASLTDALRQGAVFYRMESRDRATALRAMVDVLRLPDDVDRDLLFRMHLARESMASTGIGDGIAIPHVRNPVVLHVARPQITLCFLETPVDFGAVDGKPVRVLISLITPTIRDHLALLSQLAFALKDPGLRKALQAEAPRDRIMAEFERVEAAMEAQRAGAEPRSAA
jgi:PTS system nitrogen regulatory IIA component